MTTTTAQLEPFLGRHLMFYTNDSKLLFGRLEGFDQACNLVVLDCHERVFDEKQGAQTMRHGLFMLRGDNVALIAEFDERKDMETDWAKIFAPPLKPIVH